MRALRDSRTARRALLLIALTAIVGACDLFRVETPMPAGAVRFIAPPQYALWWRLTERCSGITRDLSAISWYAVPGADSIMVIPSRTWAQGFYELAQNRIVLAGHWRSDGGLVRHEMLHALLRRGGHPAEFFQNRCGGVVAYPPPRTSVDSTAPLVPLDDLVISARADSTAPSLARDSFYVALTVAIQNPRATPVRVRLTPIRPGFHESETFGFAAHYCDAPSFSAGSDYFWVADSTFALGPGEVRRMVFDQQTAGVCILYRMFFNVDTLPVIRVAPVP